jgi:acyl carrier protein
MDRSEILKKLEPIIKTYITQEDVVATITDESHLLRDLKINSAHLIDIVLDVEAGFGISITDEEVEKMDTVGNAVALIESKLTSA